MAKIIFTLDSETFTFVKGRSNPIIDPVKVNVVTDITDGGQMYAYDKGIQEQFFDLDFRGCPIADYDNALDWFKNVSVGAKNVFTFTDEDSVEHSVRWIDDTFSFRREENDIYYGIIRLRKEIA